MAQARSNDRDHYFLLAMIGAGVLLLFNLAIPFNTDNNIYQEMGLMLARYGKLPYLGSWDVNFPGIVYIHALAITIFGNTEIGFRILDTLVRIASAALLYQCTLKLRSREVATLAVLLYSLHFLSNYYWLAGQRDEFAVFFILWASYMLLCYEENQKKFYLFTIPLLLNAAVLFRPTYALFLLFAVGLLIWFEKQRWRDVLLYTCCITVAFWLIVLLPYFFTSGGMQEIYLATVRFNIDLYTGIRNPIRFFDLMVGSRRTILLLAVLAFLPSSASKRMTSYERLLITLFTLAGILSLVSMGKYFAYHWEPVITIAVAFAATGIWKVLSFLRTPAFRFILLVLFFAVLAYHMYPGQAAMAAFTAITHHQDPAEAIQVQIDNDSLYGIHTQKEVVQYIDRTVPARSPIECMTIDPSLTWRIGRNEATRFTRLLPVGMERMSGGYSSYQKKWQQEYMDSLMRIRPDPVIIAHGPQSALVYLRKSPDSVLRDLPGFSEFLQRNYSLDTTIGGYSIYRSISTNRN